MQALPAEDRVAASLGGRFEIELIDAVAEQLDRCRRTPCRRAAVFDCGRHGHQ
jgi:hypothetical protein